MPSGTFPELYRAVFQAARDGLVLVNDDGIYVDVNQTYAELLGSTREAVIGCHFSEFMPAERLHEATAAFVDIKAGGPGLREFPLRAVDGTLVDCEWTLHPHFLPGLSLFSARDIRGRKRAEEAIRASEERYRTLAEQLDDGIFIAGPTGRYVNANSSAAAMLGYTLPELLSIGILEVLHPDEHPRLQEHFELLAGGSAVQSDWRFRRKDGSVFTGEMTGHRLPDGRYQSIVRDVTERRMVERALRESEEMFRFISGRAQVGYWDWNIVSGHLEWSPVCRGLFSLPPGEDPSYDRFIACVHPDDRKRVDQTVRRCLESPDASGYDLEFRAPGADRSERWIHAKGDVVFEAGKAVRMVGVALDVTDSRRTAEALRETQFRLRDSEARFRTLAESIPLLVWACGPEGECDYLSRQWAEYTGIPAAEQLGDKWLAAVHPDDRERTRALWKDAVAVGRLFDVEFRLRGSDGVYRWFKTRALPHRDPAGNIIRWFGTNTDISELKEIEERLRSLNLDLEQFAYSASHDLQEPLRNINIYSELLNDRCRGKLDVEETRFLDFLRAGATRMEQLVRDLLTYTQATRIEKPVQPADATEALNAALHALSTTIRESGATIESGALPTVAVADTHLQLLFQNLVSNALKYRRKSVKADVRITAQRENDRWIFSVADNGIGIEPEYRERIFGMFKRLHNNDAYSGTGIGLAICQRIVERYHGRIWVESEPGQGSKFLFTLPV